MGPSGLQDLAARLQDGDAEALEPFIEATRDLGYRLAYSFLQDAHRCEDVLQDVYLTVYRRIHQLRDVRATRTWFCRIVANRCRRLLRDEKPASLDAIEELGESPSMRHEGLEERMDVQRLLAGLGEQDRAVITLRELFQLSYSEIAEVLEVPVGTVRSRLSKARERLLRAVQERNKP